MTDPITFTRRHFLQLGALAAGAAALPLDRLAKYLPAVNAAPAARWHRYSVTTPEGQKALASYARGVEVMLKLPPDHPHNWFRNAFVHLMDCPHGNWWFYSWHRGFLGYFEQTIRELSGDPEFALPFWDWTTTPKMPAQMFDGVLDPGSPLFAASTRNLNVFTSTYQPAIMRYMNTLNVAQIAQLKARGYPNIAAMWNDVNGSDASLPSQPDGNTNNVAYANPSGSRYLSRDNPSLDAKTTYDVSPFVVRSGLMPTAFWDANADNSFTSTRTASHTAPNPKMVFSMLEGLPHNKVHNCIGGSGNVDPGPYGFMTNFLSPVDPVFFLHHANMDRLWDIWTRKQQAAGLPFLPQGQDFADYVKEPFLFFVDSKGKFITNGRAGDYLDTAPWGYDYGPGFGEDVIPSAKILASAARPARRVAAAVHGSSATATVPAAAPATDASGAERAVVAKITVANGGGAASGRELDVLLGSDAHFAGTIAFHGHMKHMNGMPGDATFVVPIPAQPPLLGAEKGGAAPLTLRVVPSHDPNGTVRLRSVSVVSK